MMCAGLISVKYHYVKSEYYIVHETRLIGRLVLRGGDLTINYIQIFFPYQIVSLI